MTLWYYLDFWNCEFVRQQIRVDTFYSKIVSQWNTTHKKSDAKYKTTMMEKYAVSEKVDVVV